MGLFSGLASIASLEGCRWCQRHGLLAFLHRLGLDSFQECLSCSVDPNSDEPEDERYYTQQT